MNEKQKITLSLTKEAVEVLDRESSPRKRGEFVSSLLEAFDTDIPGGMDFQTIKIQLIGVMTKMAALEARVLSLESQLKE